MTDDIALRLRRALDAEAERDTGFGRLLQAVRATPKTAWGRQERERIADQWARWEGVGQ